MLGRLLWKRKPEQSPQGWITCSQRNPWSWFSDHFTPIREYFLRRQCALFKRFPWGRVAPPGDELGCWEPRWDVKGEQGWALDGRWGWFPKGASLGSQIRGFSRIKWVTPKGCFHSQRWSCLLRATLEEGNGERKGHGEVRACIPFATRATLLDFTLH